MLCTQGTYEVVNPKPAHEYLLMLNTIADSSPWFNKEGCWKRLFRTTYDCIYFQMSIATTETVLRKPWGDDYLGALLLEHKAPDWQPRSNTSYSYFFNGHGSSSLVSLLLSPNTPSMSSQWSDQISSNHFNPLLANRQPESPNAFSTKFFH